MSRPVSPRLSRGLPRGAVAVLMAVLWARAADAAPGGTRVLAHLALSAPEGCGSAEELAVRVTKRSERIVITSAEEAERTVEAAIVRAGEHWLIASMSIALPDGKPAARRFRSRSCAEALDALGLVIAIALDPTCAGRSEPELPPPDPPPPPPAPPVPPPPQQVVATVVAPKESGPPIRLGLGAGLMAQALVGAGPRVMPGLAVQLGLDLDAGSILSPSLLLMLTHVARDGYVADGGSADFALDSAGLGFCPMRLGLGRLTARPCAVLTAGRLYARGTDTFSAETHQRLFMTLGGMGVLSFGLMRSVHVVANLGAAAPLIRDSFQFSPSVFYRVPAVAWTAGLGLEIRIP